MRAFAVLISLALAGHAIAEPFWIEYRAASGQYPEEVGWTRYTREGGAVRSLGDDGLMLNGMASWGIVDNYIIERPVELGAGEVLQATWRLRVDEVTGPFDPAVTIGAGAHGAVVLTYSPSGIYSAYEGSWIAEFAPGVFHDYSLVSPDLDAYTLSIDGVAIYAGHFIGSIGREYVDWGDCTEGPSVSTWDCAAFGIVPEPSSILLAGLGALSLASTLGSLSRRERDANSIS